jgi:hypothetical protein
MKTAEAFIKTGIVAALALSFVATLALWRRVMARLTAPIGGG